MKPELLQAPGRVQPAMALNVEAGTHLVTADPEALAAVEQAAEGTRRRFPTLDLRYGERGRAFTRSDGGWLVTLAGLPPAAAQSQVDWLASLLAARGMPRLVLEDYLGRVAGALEAALPGGAPGWARLRAEGERLADARRATLPDLLLAQRGRALEAFAGTPGAGPADAAELLAAAVADERAGLMVAVPGLLSWLAEPGRFAEGWRAALLAAAEGWRRN